VVVSAVAVSAVVISAVFVLREVESTGLLGHVGLICLQRKAGNPAAGRVAAGRVAGGRRVEVELAGLIGPGDNLLMLLERVSYRLFKTPVTHLQPP
jgi:hypothetical protein